VSASGNGVPSILGVEFFSIQTDSMADTLMPGDLAVGTVVKDKTSLRKGDIITYWTVINGERVLNTHRIDAIYDGGQFLIFGTKGDNHESPDPLTVHETEVVGKYAFKIPSVGKVFDYLQTPTGFLIVIVIPVFLFFLFHLVQFFRVLFEYQNVKNRIRYEEERGRTEDVLEAREREHEMQRAELEAKLREQLRAELLADMAKQQTVAEESPAEEV
jgi:signal peptidase